MSASSSHSRSVQWTTATEDAAAAWVSRQHDGLTPSEARALEVWLAADASHAAAYRALEAAWALLNQPRARGQADLVAVALSHRQRRRLRRRRAIAGAVTVLTAVALWFSPVTPKAFFSPNLAADSTVTIALRPNVQTLPDGSSIELNAGAEVTIDFSDHLRNVRLLRGEALFTVAHDTSRPFIVTAGPVQVRAVGTAFAVRHAGEEVAVLVTEGTVAVTADDLADSAREATMAPHNTLVDAGKRLSVPRHEAWAAPLTPEPVSAQDITASLAWRGKRIEFSGTPLREAIRLFNHQNTVQLSLAKSRSGGPRISGVFWSDDPVGFVRLLEQTFDLQSRRQGDQIVIYEDHAP